MAELKPCPFCGGEAVVIDNEMYVDVSCTNFHCRGWADTLMYDSKDKAIEAWNKRAENEELEFTRKFIHEHGLDFALASAWNRRAEDGRDK